MVSVPASEGAMSEKRLQRIESNVMKLEAGVRRLGTGQKNLRRHVGQLQSGQDRLCRQVGRLETGQKRLEIGQKQLEIGQRRLEIGHKQLGGGQQSLRRDVRKLQAGQIQLGEKFDELRHHMGVLHEAALRYIRDLLPPRDLIPRAAQTDLVQLRKDVNDRIVPLSQVVSEHSEQLKALHEGRA